MTQQQTALILGATGGIGGEVAAALSRRGWQIKALRRASSGPSPSVSTPITWVTGDAMNVRDVVNAARGASLIVHAVNPPKYRNWNKLVLPMIDNTISAACASGARILLPGTIYNYGPDAFPVLREDSPQHPLTRKGHIRAEMERRLRTAANSGVSTIVVRAGDFFGPTAGNNWFSQGLITPGKQVGSVLYPGGEGVGHAWAYLPDLAEAMAELAERDSKPGVFETYHFAGHWDADGTRMIAAIRTAVGDSKLKARRFPWPLLTLLSPFVSLFREMREMRYLWKEPLRLDNQRLVSVLGREPRTQLEQAVRTTLTGLGCL